MSTSTTPTPPEGYIAITHGMAFRELPSGGRFRPDGSGRDPIDGVLVWAEGDWRPVTGFGNRFRRSVEVDYLGSKFTHRGSDGTYRQRVVPERLAVRPDVVPQWMGMQEREAEQAVQRRRAAEAAQAAKAHEKATAERARAAREAAMTPAEKLAKVRRGLEIARELVEVRTEMRDAAQASLDAARAKVTELTLAEGKLAAQAGEG